MELDQWRVFGGTVELDNPDAKVDHVDMEIVVQDTASRDKDNNEMPFYFTDLQFQPGAQKTGWIPNTQEMMDRIEFDVDEWRKYLWEGQPDDYYVWKSVSPKQYPNQTKRLFNLLGRGHEVITIPNDLPEEEFWELDLIAQQGLDRPVDILSTGIDFKIVPKDDFKLMRISTDVGAMLPVEEHLYQPPEGEPPIDHPLHYRYTREFWFDSGKAGDILEVNASMMIAKKNGVKVNANGVNTIAVDNDKINIYKNKFQMIPRGSVRFRIEFYGRDSSGQLADTGIGFGGTATFDQWTYGVERL